jgi:hypothetical protein
MTKRLAAGTNGSIPVETCQICDSRDLQSVLFVGYLPPVNTMPPVGTRPTEQPAYPAEMLRCRRCQLFQLGLIVDPAILFPPSYPYTSGTTRILRDNFAQLAEEVGQIVPMTKGNLAIDIGSNDGTLLAAFQKQGFNVYGIEPTNAAKIAVERGIPTQNTFFNADSAARAVKERGKAKVITATNVFAHIEDVHSIVKAIDSMLADDGVFISESHYLASLVKTVQYDTIYHEHLRYYALNSLKYLLEMHGLEVIHARPIPTHGGSIRVYAARKGKHKPRPSVAAILAEEAAALSNESIAEFRRRVVDSKLGLLSLLRDIKAKGQRIFGIGAPSRASTLINYVGLDDAILDCVCEIAGSYKIGKYIPGTLIPVVEESRLTTDQPDYALLLSWHLADELAPKLRAKGFRGRFIVPLPAPRVLDL